MKMEKTDLVDQISPLQAQVGRDVFVDCPRKLVVQLPCHERQRNCAQCYHTWRSQEERLEVHPCPWLDITIPKLVNGLIDLVHLHSRVDEHSQVVQAYSNDLNRVLEPERIPCKDKLVDEPEDEESQVRGNRLRWSRSLPFEVCLEFSEHIGL